MVRTGRRSRRRSDALPRTSSNARLPPVGLLGRYFATRFLTLFVALLALAIVGIAAVELLLNSDQILSTHERGGGVWRYLWLRLPAYYLRDVLPSCAFAAAFFTLAGSGQARELLAMKAGGVSPHRATRAILLAAALLAVAALALGETWVLRSRVGWSRLVQPHEPIAFRGGTFWYHRGDAIYNVGAADAERGRLEAVRIFELGPEGRLQRSVEARRGQWSESTGRWRLEDGWVRHFDPVRGDWPAAAEPFEQRTLEVGLATGRAIGEADPGLLSLRRLRALHAAGGGEAPERVAAVLHRRAAEPLALCVLSLTAIPIGLGVRDLRGLGRRCVLGIGVVALFFALRTASATLADEGLLPPALAAWGLLAAFALPTLVALARVRR